MLKFMIKLLSWIGITQLLCSDNEDDENFWAYHVTNTTDMDFSRDEHN